MNDEMRAAMDKVFEELMAMPRDEFLEELEKHGDGDITRILIYSGAFEIELDNLVDGAGKPISVEIETVGQAKSFIKSCRAGREDGERFEEMFGEKNQDI